MFTFNPCLIKIHHEYVPPTFINFRIKTSFDSTTQRRIKEQSKWSNLVGLFNERPRSKYTLFTPVSAICAT